MKHRYERLGFSAKLTKATTCSGTRLKIRNCLQDSQEILETTTHLFCFGKHGLSSSSFPGYLPLLSS